MMKKKIVFMLALCLVWVVGLAVVAHGLTIPVTIDAGNSSQAYHGSSVSNLTTDGFAYDVLNPTGASPVQVWGAASAYHANEPGAADVYLSFLLDAPVTTDAWTTSAVADLWGREPSGGWTNRDDNIDVVLYNGDYITPVATVSGLAIPNPPDAYVRGTFNLAEGVTFDRFQIVGHESAGAANNAFTLFEVRLAFPIVGDYIWTGTADNNWSNKANWVGGLIPVDSGPGTNIWDAGLTLSSYSKSIMFTGANLPTTDFPGIGGNYPGKDSPTMLLNSGGAATFDVVPRDGGFWTDAGGATRTVLTVGDGVGGGTEDVSLTLNRGTVSLNRHAGGSTNNVLVNSDGTLIFSGNLDFSYNNTRAGTLTIAGGSVTVTNIVSGDIADPGNFVEFTTPGGSFTATYGGGCANIGVVYDRLGVDFINTMSNGVLDAVSNGDGTFTVTPGEPYVWTGAAGDSDWSNTTNWVSGNLPMDNDASSGLTLHYTRTIEFIGTNLPSLNMPQIGGVNTIGADTPSMVFNSGGTITLDAGRGPFGGLVLNTPTNRTLLTVGDGIGGGTEDVVVNIGVNTGHLSRHGNDATNHFEVKSDGTLNFTGNIDFSFDPSRGRLSTMTIDGGTVTARRVLDLTSAGCYVDFTAVGGTFTANLGVGDFTNMAVVESSLGVDFLNNSGGTLLGIDNSNGTFTVAAVREISWAAATTIAGDSDVYSRGTLEYAYAFGSGSLGLITVNGVPFQSGTNFAANVSLAGLGATHDAYTSAASPFGDLSSAHQALLNGGNYSGGLGSQTIVLRNLAPGEMYLVQLWISDARGTGNGRSAVIADTAVTVDYNSTDAAGGVGQYVIGTLLADDSGQAPIFLTSATRQLNALQVRAVPFLAFGGTVLMIR
jgi:hypothetical protein